MLFENQIALFFIFMKPGRIIKEYFSYTTSERRGLLVLVAILLIVFILPFVFESEKPEPLLVEKLEIVDSLLNKSSQDKKPNYKLFAFNPNTVSKEEMQKLGFTNFQIRNIIKYRLAGGEFENAEDLKNIYGFNKKDYDRIKSFVKIPELLKAKQTDDRAEKIELVTFNPNTISYNQWIKLGVDDRVAKRIKNYLATGARFSKAEDLLSVYGLDSLLFLKLQPYVRIKILPKPDFELIDINLADASKLRELPGIGKVLSDRIVKYRKLLGGFVDINQLREVYGITENTFLKIKDKVSVNESFLRKLIDINNCTVESLNKHPYINKRTAIDIVKYRKRNGNFTSLIDLQEKYLVSDSVYTKIKDYLIIEES